VRGKVKHTVSNSLTLSEIAGGFPGSVCFFEDDTNVPYNLLGSASYVLFSFSEIYLKTLMIIIYTNNTLTTNSCPRYQTLLCYGFQTHLTLMNLKTNHYLPLPHPSSFNSVTYGQIIFSM
jgi:hypothetical protein